MRIFGAGIVALAFCLGGCAAPAANGLAAGNDAAPAGPCPFRNRGWRAVVAPEGTSPELRIALTGETRNDSSGRVPMTSSADSPPPTIFLDIDSEGSLPPPPPGNSADGLQPAPDSWQEGTFYYAYRPGHVTAVIRCNGREVARVAIPAPH